jgi:ATP-dependent RNA helicase SUPV3L1/SUV3
MLKPAPRQLALLLWALKHGGLSQKGMSELPALAASGRTSIPNDREIQKSLYRAAGYRVSGTRSVRVDILERLADLIRPAIAWKPSATGEKPAGAIDGFGFTVAVGMTSLVGCSGEDFAAVLRSLGYRMDRRPAPVEAKTEEAKPEEAAPPETVPAIDPVAEVTSPLSIESTTPEAPAISAGAVIQPVPDAAPPGVTAEPAMIEVWRPGRPREQRKPERKRAPRKEAAKAPDGTPAQAAPETPTERPRTDPRDKRGQERGKDRNQDRGKDRNQRSEVAAFKPRPERREKPIDPNSPFASLLALKERMMADKKD